jgi:hypothetical protein
MRHKTILFYPEIPHESYVIDKICSMLGYKKTANVNNSSDLAINWEDITFRSQDCNLSEISNKREVVNIKCSDISKKRVDAIFKEVFGYSLTIDPLKHSGLCAKKSDLNGMHDGGVIKCPVTHADPNFVYQKVVDNCVNGNLIQDIRIPVFKSKIPFIYFKYRPIQNRFSNENSRVEISEVIPAISKDEKEKIITFCDKIGLDYGEIDAARDRENKRLYILDVNNTPYGPPNHLSFFDNIAAYKKLAHCFEEVLMNGNS